MRLAVVALREPKVPLLNGYDLHVYGLVAELARSGAQVKLIVPEPASPSEGGLGEREGIEVVSVPGAKRTMRLFRLLGHAGFGLRRIVRREIEDMDADVVLVISGRLACAVTTNMSRLRVLGAIDATHLNIHAARELSSGVARVVHRLREVAIRRSMRIHYPSYSAVVAVTPEDAGAIASVVPGLHVESIPNGVVVGDFAPAARASRMQGRLLFTGVMSYPPNEAAATFLAERILPIVRESAPDAHLLLVGRDPSVRVTALADQPGVTVTGATQSMEPHLSSAAIFTCAMVSGTGIKNKLLEAMANGLPCVVTPLASRGLAVKHQEHVLIAESAEDFAGSVLELLSDPSLRATLGAAGRDYVIRNHSWESTARRYIELMTSTDSPE